MRIIARRYHKEAAEAAWAEAIGLVAEHAEWRCYEAVDQRLAIRRPGTGYLRRAMAGLMLVLALASLDGNIVGPALPRIVSDLGGLAHLSWVVTGFAVASHGDARRSTARLSDQFGRKAGVFAAIGIFLVGSMLCGAAQQHGELIAARALQGMGAGGLIMLAQTSVADLVSPRERGRYQGLLTAVFALCSVAGPLLGGVITDWLSWPWIFYVNLPVGATALGLILTTPSASRPAASRRY